MKTLKKILISLAVLLAGCVILFLGFLLLAQLLEYRPEAVISLLNTGNKTSPESPVLPETLSFFSWNLGYCGLDAETDFVMEGGRLSRARSREAVRDNLKEITKFIHTQPADLLLLQEVDSGSARSFYLDQAGALTAALPAYRAWYALNYKAFFVPYPLSSPIGKVRSGLLTLSRYPAVTAERLRLPGSYSWPVRLLHLKRCMTAISFPSPLAGRDWYILHLHLSAYDSAGSLRRQQLGFIRDYILELYASGHFVVVGGDWNSLFPGLTVQSFAPYTTAEEYLFWVQTLPENWTPANWQWVYDSGVPSSRSLEQPYRAGENFTTIIDGFLVSPNLRVMEVRGSNLQFAHTDHNPVFMRLKIAEAIAE